VKYIPLIILMAVVASCGRSPAKQDGAAKYFEGFVEFKVSFVPQDSRPALAWTRAFGIKTVTYLGKGGFFCREYVDSNNIILNREIFRPDSMRFYEWQEGSDTVLSSDVTRPSQGAQFTGVTKAGDYKILNHAVDIVKARSGRLAAQGDTVYVYSTYYNDPNYAIDPRVYKGVVFEGIEEMFSHSPHLTVGSRFQFGDNFTVTYTATRIVKSDVPAWHFEIPKNKTIVYAN